MTTWIVTTNATRQREWERIFGMTALPVVNDQPVSIRVGRGVYRSVFILDTAALSPMQRSRLAAKITRECHVTYNQALAMLDGWTVSAQDCITAENPKSAVIRIPKRLLRKHLPQEPKNGSTKMLWNGRLKDLPLAVVS